ncbi:hypothetical protein LTR36_007587 [Oleoguttula mirabilis]|uniref:RRM domain-containing protein n=1 Tax=Oleoguttula mirabilis TaxID=1507867 RepID=A0AAV9JU99_9PEZI|nr:hypothetical protein LTR36_007587 [Oleoguttula mirabilis]
MSTVPSSSRTSNVGPYFFHIEGLPRKYTWQDLKDLIRSHASHGIWTDMAIYPNGQTGGKGYARVQRPDEAHNLYQYLTGTLVEKRKLRIHLWDTSRSEARFMVCNCDSTTVHSTQSYPAQGLEVSRMALAPGWLAVTPASPMSSTQSSYTVTPAAQYAQLSASPSAVASTQSPQAAMHAAMANLQLGPKDPRLQDPRYMALYQHQQYQQMLREQAAVSQQQAARLPVYALSSTGTPINTSHGTVRTEARGIFVSGLNYKARTKEVEAYFRRAGEVTKCELQKDPSSGKSKGNAMIQYASAAEAQRAIDIFHGTPYMTMRLNVRRDKEATAVSPPPAQASRSSEPIIVNGSQVC